VADYKKLGLNALAYVLLSLLFLILLTAVVQGWKEHLDARYFTTLGFVAIVALTVLLWKRLALWGRVHLVGTALLVLIGFLALWYGTDAKTSFKIGPFTLSFLVDLLLFFSLSLALSLLLLRLKISKGLRIGIGVFGLLCSIPYLIGMIRDISVSGLLRGEGFLHFLPWFLQPAFLGLVLLFPVLLIFLVVDFFRAAKAENRSTLSGGLNLLMALVPLAIGLSSIGMAKQAGVVTRYFADHSYGSFKKQSLEKSLGMEWKNPPVTPQSGDRFWVEWEGFLQIPKDGDYEFQIQGDGSGFLYVDGKQAFGGDQRSGMLSLKGGRYPFRAGAIEEKKDGKFLVQWRKKGEDTYQAIDPKYLSYAPSQEHWRRTPRQAAQVGIDWLQSASMQWQNDHGCFGCHVQGQVLMGLTVAQKNKYLVNPDFYKSLFEYTQKKQNEDGSYHNDFYVTATQFADMGMGYVQAAQGSKKNSAILKASDFLLSKQKENGEFEADHNEPPIDQGSIMASSNAVFGLMEAYRESGDEKYKKAADKALQFVTTAPAETTQDQIFKILAFSEYGNSSQKDLIPAVVDNLKKQQTPEGGWKETQAMQGANPFATGQVLYAFKKAGVSINSPEFTKGVRFLLDSQKLTGDWPAQNTQTGRPSEFAPTMWAVIGLAGSFGEIMPEIFEPADRSSVQGTVTLKARVTNFTDSDIASLEFSVDGKSLGKGLKAAAESSYTIPWNTEGIPNGEHKITAVATNQAGQKGETTISVFTGFGLKVKITNPANGATVTGDQPITAQAEGLYGQSVRKVEFLANGKKFAEIGETQANNQYQTVWSTANLPDGNYMIQAVATNGAGQQVVDQIQLVKKAPLSVKITAPSSGQTVSGLNDCKAEVTNNTDSPVSYVEFFLDSDTSLGRSPADKFVVPCQFTNVAPGPHTLKVMAVNGLGMNATDQIPLTIGDAKGPGYLKVELKNLDEANGEQVLYFPPDAIELVFDMSGSMWEQIQGKSKIEIARDVLAALVQGFPKDVNFALRVYGHRSKSDCKDTELLVPFGKLDTETVKQKVNALKPKGMTLIDFSLREALKDMQPQNGSKIVILVTDGIETCKGDPVKAAQDLMAAGLKMKIHVVGFNVSNSAETVEQLKKVAEVGQGKFYTAENAEQMNQALAEAVKVGYAVFDEQGNQVYTKPLSQESTQLMSGTYKVVVNLDPLLVLPAVKIEKDKTSTVEVIKQNKAFRIESPQTSQIPESATAPAANPGMPVAPIPATNPGMPTAPLPAASPKPQLLVPTPKPQLLVPMPTPKVAPPPVVPAPSPKP